MIAAIKLALEQYGFSASMMIFIAFMLYYVLKFAKENIKDIMKQAVDREEAQRDIIKDQQKAVQVLANEIRSGRRASTKDHAKMSQGLNEVTQALGRINGFKNKN